jgi:hypothetical protein
MVAPDGRSHKLAKYRPKTEEKMENEIEKIKTCFMFLPFFKENTPGIKSRVSIRTVPANFRAETIKNVNTRKKR